MTTLTCIAKLKAKPGHEAVVKHELSQLLAPTRLEDGCIRYDLHVDNADPSVFMFYETWQSDAHLDRHMESDHLKRCIERMDGLLEQLEVSRLSRVE